MSIQAGEKYVSITTLSDYAPYTFIEGNGTVNGVFPPGTNPESFKGYSWDILRESFHVMGRTIKLDVFSWPRAMSYLLNQKIDVLFPTGKNAEREKIFYYSNEKVNTANFLIYVKKGHSINWSGLDSLKGLKIGEIRSFNYGDEWNRMKGEVSITKFGTIKQGFRMLESGRIDGFIGYEFNWDYLLNKWGWDKKFSKLPVFGSTGEYLVVMKTNPQGKDILREFDQGLRELKRNGKFLEIQKKWLGK